MLEQHYYERFAASLSDSELTRRLRVDSDEMLRFAPLLRELPTAGSLLDVGCGHGVLLAALRQQRPQLRAVGLERSRSLTEAGRRLFGVEITQGSLTEIPFDDRAFDVVVACEVLEHLPFGAYESALSEIRRVAGSMVIVTVPYRETRESAVCPYCQCRFDSNYHMRRFDENALRDLFPGLRPARMVPIIASRSLLSGPAAALRRLWQSLNRGADFPPHALCPQCGYSVESPSGAVDDRGSHRGRAAIFLKTARAVIPKVARVRWMMAVYETSNPANGPRGRDL